MAYTTTTASVVMRDKVETRVRATFPEEDNTLAAFMDEAPKERTNIRGRRMSFRVRPNASFGSIAEGALLPLAGAPLDVEGKVYYLNQFKTGEINKEVLDQDDDDAMVNFMSRNMKDDTQTFNNDLNLWMFGLGDGSLGVLSADSTTTLTFGGDYGSENIRIGARLEFYDASAVKRVGGAAVVSTVLTNNKDTGVITVDQVPNDLAATDTAHYEASYGRAFHGLPYHVRATTDTWLTLSPATYPSLKSTVHDSVGNALTPGMLDLVQAKTQKFAGVNNPINDFALIMHNAQAYNYKQLGYGSGMNINLNITAGGKLDLGFKEVMHNGMRFRIDNQCARSDIYGVRFSDWAIEFIKLPGFYTTAEGNKLWQKSGTGAPYDAVQFALNCRMDLVLKRRERQFRITNLPYVAGL